jgi:hypothetical protein
MGERKVLNFYVSPDFDASIIPRHKKKDRAQLIEVRTMLPFSMRCNICGEYMYRGKKFNSRKENMPGEDYMGIRRFRFYIKCAVCSAEITFCTDPKNSDYECESGAMRNFEMWRENDKNVEEDEKVREEEDKVDAMKALENRTLDSKVEMDVLDALDEIQAINQRHERVDTNMVLNSLEEQFLATSKKEAELAAVARAGGVVLANGLTVADEELIRSINFKKNSQLNKMLPDSDEEDEKKEKVASSSSETKNNGLDIEGQIKKQMAASSSAAVKAAQEPKLMILKKKVKRSSGDDSSSLKGEGTSCSAESSKKQKVAPIAVAVPVPVVEQKIVLGLGGLMAYGSDDSDE